MRILTMTVLIWAAGYPALADADTQANGKPSQAEKADQDPVPVRPPEGLVPKHLLLVSDTDHSSPYVFVADKASRTLSLWSQEGPVPKLVDAFAMDLGRREGDKVALGDHKTPEGIYFLLDRYEGPGLDFQQYGIRAFPLDYPNFFDRLAGKTGSGIWLHSVPDTTSLFRGSRGCVVVRINVIEKVTPYISLKRTPMVILDRVEYVKPDVLKSERSKVLAWLEEWRGSWETKDLDSYMTHYDDKFRAMRMGKRQWQNYKRELNEKYNFIKVAIDKPLILKRRDDMVIRFIQDYQSDGLKDHGEKTLYVRATDNGLKIVTEEWRPLNVDVIAKKSQARN